MHMAAGEVSSSASGPVSSRAEQVALHEERACVACVWNAANHLRAHHGLPLKDFHISLAPGGTELRLHSLDQLLPASPFQLDEHKLVQVNA